MFLKENSKPIHVLKAILNGYQGSSKSKKCSRAHRQPDLHTEHENRTRKDWDYQVSDKVLLWKDGILRKSESHHERDPWTITSVHTNGTIWVQHGTKSERLNIRRVTPSFEN